MWCVTNQSFFRVDQGRYAKTDSFDRAAIFADQLSSTFDDRPGSFLGARVGQELLSFDYSTCQVARGNGGFDGAKIYPDRNWLCSWKRKQRRWAAARGKTEYLFDQTQSLQFADDQRNRGSLKVGLSSDVGPGYRAKLSYVIEHDLAIDVSDRV